MNSTKHEKIEFYRLRDFSEKLGATFSFLRQNFKSLLKTLLVLAGPVVLLSMIIQTLVTMQFTQNLNSYDGVGGGAIGFYGAGQLLNMVFWGFTGMVILAATYSYMQVYDKVGPGKVTVDRVFAKLKKKLGKVIGGLLLLGLIMGFAALLSVFMIGLPLIILGVFWAIYFPILFFEDTSPGAALGRSFNLTGDKWFSTLGQIFILLVVTYAAALYLIVPIVLLMGLPGIMYLDSNQLLDEESSQFGAMILTALYSLVFILLSTIQYVGLAFQYFNLVERRENRGFAQKIALIGVAPATEEDESY